MATLPPRARLFFWVIVSLAAGLGAHHALILAGEGAIPAALALAGPREWITAGLAVAAMIVTGLYPICLGPGSRIRTSVGASVIFATALVMPPPTTLALVAGSVACYTLVSARRHGWPLYYPFFNVAQLAVTAVATSHVAHAARGGLDLTSPRSVAAVVLAAVTYFAVNSTLVATMAALAQERTPAHVWAAMYRRIWPRNLAVLLLGVLLTVVSMHAPAAVILFVVPLAVIHQAYSTAVTVQNQTRETLEMLADAIDKRDRYTFAHSQRVADLAHRIAGHLRLPPEDQDAIAQAARVHDLGKVGVADEILYKPAALDREELASIRNHTVIGATIVGKLPAYRRGKEFILFHHERYDGGGMFGLSAEHIPLGARIIAVADAFDAMTSDRPYRKALPVSEVLEELHTSAGSQFDPMVVAALEAVLEEHAQVAGQPAVAC